ncbi:Ig-like domain-containing protein [Hymenobacter negativus]|uniref:Ig domain-containing protein n=1 Tax=Hymenobacter negativus TaxID=2795026 RepID=A0ABS3QKW0_9BACT|nr:Ig-like domain-containing protein [Hymenobacter negativus]MBO2011797.1 putative Ig domain-containing protein [Hymenobacter negativus]
MRKIDSLTALSNALPPPRARFGNWHFVLLLLALLLGLARPGQAQTTTVSSVTRLIPSPTATAQVRYRVTFAGAIAGVTTSNFAATVTSGSISGASISSVSGSNTTYTVTVNTGTGDGTLRLDVVNGTGISPTPSNVPYTAGEVYTITKSFAAAPQLTIAGTGGTGSDVTAFVDLVRVLQNGTGTGVSGALQNGSLEQYDPLANGDYGYQPTNAFWTFNAQSGIAEDGSAFTPTTPIPNGIAVAFVQSNGGGNGQLQQNLALPTGSYQVSFQAAQRLCCTTLDQALNVFLNGVFVGNLLPGTNGYTTFTSATFSVTAPALTATVSTTSASPTSTTPIPFSVSFSQSVGTTFTASDVTVTGGTLNSASFGGAGSGPYTFTVTPSGTGTVTVSLTAGVATDANNTGNAASNAVSVQYAQPVTAAPVVIVPANGSFVSTPTPTYGGTAPAGSLIRLYVDGLVLANTTTANSAGNWAITQPTALTQGSHTVYATAQSSGNAVSANSATNTFTVDSVRPSVAISSTTAASGSSTNTTPFAFTVTFSENVTGFVAGDVSVNNGTLTGFTRVSGAVYTFSVTPTTAGIATTVNIPANVAQDQAGNGNTAAASAYSLTFQVPTITVAPATLPNGTQATAYSQTLTASGGTAPYTFAITAGALPAGLSLTTAGTLSGTPTGNGTFTFTVTATDASAASGPFSGSRAYTLTIAAPVVTAVTWNGTTSTNWFDATNWTPNQVPDATIDVTIPNSTIRFPFIVANSPANARNLSIAANASLTMTTNTLILAANLTNNGSFNGFSGSNGGTLVMGGSALGQVNGSGVNRFWSLTVGPNGVQLNNSNVTSVRRVLALNGNFTTNGNPFTLISDAAGTAMVVNNGGAVVNGNTTVQRYIDPSLNPNLGYRHVSPAISSATVNSLATSGFSPVVNPAYNTSPTPLLVPTFPTVYGYDQARLASTANNLNAFDKGWFSPNAATDPLAVGQGYTVLINGGQTWNFTGALNNGTRTLSLARNSGTTAPDAGYALIGNPYPSPLDWSQTSSQSDATQNGLVNVDPTMYVYQSNDPSNPYTGVYNFYNNGIGTTSPVVAQGQGFFVRVSDGQTAGSVTFKNSHRPTSYQPTTYRRTTETRPLVELHLQGAGSTLTDAAFVYFEQGASDRFEAQFDTEKLPNPSGLNLSTSLSATQRLAIDGRAPLGTAQRVVPLTVGVPAVGSYTLSAAQLLNLGTTPVYLRDLQSGAVIDLRTQPNYSFTVSNASALLTGRFELLFSPQAPLATAPAALAAQVGLYPNPATTTAFVELPAALGRTAVAAELVDALGRTVRTQSLPAQGATAHRLSLVDLATGVYTLHLKTSAGVIVKKLVVE